MWPYTHEENDWLTGRARIPDISPQDIDHYIAKAHRLRAERYAELGRGFLAGLRRLTTRPARPVKPATPELPLDEVMHELRTPLTSIRAFSEILRNHPDLTDGQRARYLDIILSDSRRMERTINQIGQSLYGEPSPGQI
ncbi:MAG: histidine kinase dimerization/phospho-acceptor domain-containing protein [Pseudomonadota bacterium]